MLTDCKALGGACPTVGASGGYITGGGHSLLGPVHGLGVDNVMQMKAVLPNGTYITANRCQNQEMFFALRGGGAASFGVVTETTSRVFPEVPLQVSQLTLLLPFHQFRRAYVSYKDGSHWLPSPVDIKRSDILTG